VPLSPSASSSDAGRAELLSGGASLARLPPSLARLPSSQLTPGRVADLLCQLETAPGFEKHPKNGRPKDPKNEPNIDHRKGGGAGTPTGQEGGRLELGQEQALQLGRSFPPRVVRLTFNPPWNVQWLQAPVVYEVYSQEAGRTWHVTEPMLRLEGGGEGGVGGDGVGALLVHTVWVRVKAGGVYGQYAPSFVCKGG
jgi:hypothetical protein